MITTKLSEFNIEEFPVYVEHFGKFYLVEHPAQDYVHCVYPTKGSVTLELFEGRTYNVYSQDAFQKYLEESEGSVGKVNVLTTPDTQTPSSAGEGSSAVSGNVASNFGAMPTEGLAEKAEATAGAQSILSKMLAAKAEKVSSDDEGEVKK